LECGHGGPSLRRNHRRELPHGAAQSRCGDRWPSANHPRMVGYARGTFGGNAMNDPIVDEVRRVRDAHAAMFNYDLDAIFEDIKEKEKKSGLKFVSYPPRRTGRSQSLQPTGAAAPISEASKVAETAPAAER